MRTTVDIDETVLRAARALAAQSSISLGRALSELALRGMRSAARTSPDGFPLIPRLSDQHVITDELVARHRDDRAHVLVVPA